MAVLAAVVAASCLQVISWVLKFIFQDDIINMFLVTAYILVMRLILSKTTKMRKYIVNGSNEPKFIKESRVPTVYSKDVWMLCDALGIEAKWAFCWRWCEKKRQSLPRLKQ
ncbi:hypothetical protein CEXT_804751 [Caerostris extrusa]|uniref:Uncharacterized protein n=1 Tax=Caerostris extrusa TaxID=172846 RepID=A0AAV4RPL2_CAEEX|nr:hypothetical protein CEXT_804751 [Caerostris extrusa]